MPGYPWQFADVRLAVDLLGTLRLRDGELVDELADERAAASWLARQLPHQGRRGSVRAELVGLRELIRTLFTSIVEGTPIPPGTIATINGHAARSKVTLRARTTRDGTILVERTHDGTPAEALRAELARSALTLLMGPDRERLELCRAPGCILFFLKGHPRQQWCSRGCGNRARVARHYARHTHPKK